ncbi:MAG: molybdate ABC transporter substrate-binding protein [Pseudomonadota bacterium]
MHRAFFGFFCFWIWISAALGQSVTVFAAASLRPVLDPVFAQSNTQVATSYAASSTLARQIEFGAAPDLFVSANPAWVDHLLAAGVVPITPPQYVASNQLVLAGAAGKAPVDWSVQGLTQARGAGRIAVPLVDAVPLGQYTKAALQAAGLFDAVLPVLAQTDNAATARALLETGAVTAAFLYASDVDGTDLAVLHPIDPALHPTVIYVGLALTPAGSDLLGQLRTPAAQSLFQDKGFVRVD